MKYDFLFAIYPINFFLLRTKLYQYYNHLYYSVTTYHHHHYHYHSHLALYMYILLQPAARHSYSSS